MLNCDDDDGIDKFEWLIISLESCCCSAAICANESGVGALLLFIILPLLNEHGVDGDGVSPEEDAAVANAADNILDVAAILL